MFVTGTVSKAGEKLSFLLGGFGCDNLASGWFFLLATHEATGRVIPLASPQK